MSDESYLYQLLIPFVFTLNYKLYIHILKSWLLQKMPGFLII